MISTTTTTTTTSAAIQLDKSETGDKNAVPGVASSNNGNRPSLETPRLSTISPSINPSGVHFGISPSDINNSASTAEFVSKYLGQITDFELKKANPFEVKFREANLQIRKSTSAVQSPEQAAAVGGGLETPTIAGLSTSTGTLNTVLRLPPLSSSANQSPSIFPALSSQLAYNLLSATSGGMQMQKSLNAIQQLREAAYNRTSDDTSNNNNLATADVLKGVLEVLDGSSPNPLYNLPSSATLAASFASAAAAVVNHPQSINSGSGEQFAEGNPAKKSQFEQFAASTASVLQQQSSNLIPPPSSSTSMISIETLMSLPSAVTAAVARAPTMNILDSGTSLAVPALMSGSSGTHSTPASTAISPRSPNRNNLGATDTGLKKASSSSNFISNPLISDPWNSTRIDLKPDINTLNSSAPASRHLPPLYASGGGKTADTLSPPAEEIPRAGNKHSINRDGHKPRKYTRYHSATSSNNDSQVSSTRGGRGRRPLTAEMPPDERRSTILERNKAAAVRYRKRKKEEHDDMIGRVQEMEDDRQKLMVQIQVLTRELRNTSEQLELVKSKCVCRAKHLVVNSTLSSSSANDGGHDRYQLMEDFASATLPNSRLNPSTHPHRPSSQHSMH